MYILHNSPVWIGRDWFVKINTLFRELIWRKGQARISLQTLQRPAREGGMTVPHPYRYFLAAQLQHLGGCESLGAANASGKIMLVGSPHKSLAGALEAGSLRCELPTHKMVGKVWQSVKRDMGYKGLTEFSPIWHNKQLQELLAIEKNRMWEGHGIYRLAQLFDGNILKSFTDLGREFGIPKETFYGYLQIRHALDKQFRNKSLEWCKTPFLNKVARTASSKGLISAIYGQLTARITMLQTLSRTREGWEADVGELADDQWSRILELGPLVSVSPSQQASHLLLLHRAYYTPKKLHRFGRRLDDKCPRCLETGDLFHMMWRCPKLVRYWSEILNIIETRFRIRLELEAKVCVLGLVKQNLGNGSIVIAVVRCLYQARKLIAQSWLSVVPPTPEDWVRTIDALVRTEKIIHTRRGSYRKYVKIWKLWLQGMNNPL